MEVGSISRVLVIEDDRNTREEIVETLLDAELTPIPVVEQLGSLEHGLKHVLASGDALLCDYRLAEGGYQNFTGAELVAGLTGRSFPAVLFSRYPSRRFRQLLDRVPVILTANDAASNPDVIVDGFRYCMEEHCGQYSSERRPWRTLVRVEDEYPRGLTVSLPAWDHRHVVHLDYDQIPVEILSAVRSGQKLLHARVNLGESDPDRLYFLEWENK